LFATLNTKDKQEDTFEKNCNYKKLCLAWEFKSQIWAKPKIIYQLWSNWFHTFELNILKQIIIDINILYTLPGQTETK
jgi:hypothetical protein